MKKPISRKKRTGTKLSVGQEVITSLKEAIVWAGGEDTPVRVTKVEVPTTDVRAVGRKLRLSQSQFAAKFGFRPATVKKLGAGPHETGWAGAGTSSCDCASPGSSGRRSAKGQLSALR